MTEDEAKKRWCPFARLTLVVNSGSTTPAANRIAGETGDVRLIQCIGSACMAWQEHHWTDTRSRHLVDKISREPINSGTVWNSEWVLDNPDEPEPPRHGHCGLAGQVLP